MRDDSAALGIDVVGPRQQISCALTGEDPAVDSVEVFGHRGPELGEIPEILQACLGQTRRAQRQVFGDAAELPASIEQGMVGAGEERVPNRTDDVAGKRFERRQRRQRMADEVLDVHRIEVEHVEGNFQRAGSILIAHTRDAPRAAGKQEFEFDRVDTVTLPVGAQHETGADGIQNGEVELRLK